MSAEAIEVWRLFFLYYGIIGGAVMVAAVAIFALSLTRPMMPPQAPPWAPPEPILRKFLEKQQTPPSDHQS